MEFSTKDDGNDQWGGNCAIFATGAQWYKHCYDSNLNGQYGVDSQGKGVTWNTWRGWEHSLLFTEMKSHHS